MPFLTNARRNNRRQQLAAALARIPAEALATYPLTKAEIQKLFDNFTGQLVFRDDPAYAQDRRGNSMYPYLAYPFVIAYCETTTDVALCLSVAHDYVGKIPFTVRSGGHSNCGYSVTNGLVIDLSRINGVMVAPDHTSVVVEAGANLGKVNDELVRYGLHVPGGECDTVGVAGHSMGGGYGFTSRLFGLNCDAVVRIWMMLHDGRTVMADTVTNPDLFWAVRGATGNTLGVLLKIEYKTVPLQPVWAFVIFWPISQAPAVLAELQKNYIRTGLFEIGYQCAIARNGEGPEALFFMGMYPGDPAIGRKLIAPLVALCGGAILQEKVGLYAEMNSFLLSWYALPSPVETTMEVKQSNYIARPLTVNEWAKIIQFYLTKPNPYNMCAFEIYGGMATNPGTRNAFIHREVDCDMFIDSFSNTAWPNCPPAVADKWAADFNALMQNFSTRHKYQNYPNSANSDYRWNYWGDAFNSLLFVKNKYDSANFFNFEQGITPPPDDPKLTVSTSPSIWSDPVIVYEPGQNQPKPG